MGSPSPALGKAGVPRVQTLGRLGSPGFRSWEGWVPRGLDLGKGVVPRV